MKQLIIAIIFTGAAIGVFFTWTNPLISHVSNQREELKGLESTRDRFFALRKTKNNLIESYNAISPDELKRLERVIPLSSEEMNLITTLDSLTTMNSLLLKRIDIESEENKSESFVTAQDSYESLSISLVVDGTYDSFKSFLRDLESSLRIIDIDNLTFSAGDKNSYEFNISAKAYFYEK